MTAFFVKHYRDPRRAALARAHRAWLDALGTGVPLPVLHAAADHYLVFEHLGHRHPEPDDLPILARTLGLLHEAAHRRQLHRARLDAAFVSPDGMIILDFVAPRRLVLDRLPLATHGLPVAFYKDANIRNFVLTEHGPAVVDFDDLTLAPFGYDLAKLIVSAAMTYGVLDRKIVDEALAGYNESTAGVGHAACSAERLHLYAEFHHLCTRPYLYRNAYRYPWPDVRPWRS